VGKNCDKMVVLSNNMEWPSGILADSGDQGVGGIRKMSMVSNGIRSSRPRQVCHH
jgi:hypothetical protein